MAGIIPKTTAGALAANSALVENAATPAAPFQFDCDYLGLPSNCTARILPSQINAIVSEMVNLAACFDPDGTWQCANLNNLCTAFTNYRTATAGDNTLWQDIQTLVCGMTEVATDDDSRFLYCDGNGAIHKAPVTLCADIVAAICGSDPCRQTLAACLISPDEADQGILISATSGLLYQRSHGIVFRTNITKTLGNPVADFDLLVLDQSYAQAQFTIPNTSDVAMDGILYSEFDLRLVEQINNAKGEIRMLLYSDPARTVLISNNVYVYDNWQGAGGPTYVATKPMALDMVTVPPGGITLYWDLQGYAEPNTGWRAEAVSSRWTFQAYAMTVTD